MIGFTESQRGCLVGWRTGILVVRFVTLVRAFSARFVSVEADVVMRFGSVGGCMIPPNAVSYLDSNLFTA